MHTEDILYPFLKAYIGSPQWVKSAMGGAYALIPRSLRYGRAYRRFLQEATCAPEAVAAHAEIKLGSALRWAIETVPAYRSYRELLCKDIMPSELLRSLPTVSKDQIKADTESYLSRNISPALRLKTFTGGSTASPMQFYLHKNVTRPKEYAYMENFQKRVGMGRDNVVLALRGRTVPTAGKPGGRLWMYEPIKRQLILSSDHLEPDYMPAYIEAMHQWKPAIIQAFPSALYPLARWLAEHPSPGATERIRGILLFSENVYDFQMRLFRSVFGCPVLKHYGHSERALMAASMVDDERYFFWPLYGKFELLDAQGCIVTQPGVLGEIVGTGFDNEVMPFVRYRTGDMAMLSEQSHPLLPGFPVCERIEGRLQEFVICKDRRLISITTLGAAHFDQLASVEAIQYEQREAGTVILNVVARQPLDNGVRSAIAIAMQEKTQGGCNIEIRQVADIERTARGKHKMLIQHLDIGSFLGASGSR